MDTPSRLVFRSPRLVFKDLKITPSRLYYIRLHHLGWYSGFQDYTIYIDWYLGLLSGLDQSDFYCDLQCETIQTGAQSLKGCTIQASILNFIMFRFYATSMLHHLEWYFGSRTILAGIQVFKVTRTISRLVFRASRLRHLGSYKGLQGNIIGWYQVLKRLHAPSRLVFRALRLRNLGLFKFFKVSPPPVQLLR